MAIYQKRLDLAPNNFCGVLDLFVDGVVAVVVDVSVFVVDAFPRRFCMLLSQTFLDYELLNLKTGFSAEGKGH